MNVKSGGNLTVIQEVWCEGQDLAFLIHTLGNSEVLGP